MNIEWTLYNGVLLPNTPPHINIELSESEVNNLIKKYKPYFIRTTSDFDSKKRYPFYYIIRKNKIDINELSKNTRSKVRRGLKHCSVEKINNLNNELIRQMYEVYKKAFDRYNNIYIKLQTFENFSNSLINSSYDIWIVKKDDIICAYSLVNKQNNIANTSVLKYHPNYLKYYSSYALIFTILQYYLNQNNYDYVHNGSISLGHDTNIQDWLVDKFKFKKTYAKLNIYYRNDIKLAVNFLYPFRKFIKNKKIRVLLKHEEIRRKCEQIK